MTSKKICKIGNNYYLYERKSYWDPIQKRSRQRNSRYLGKCDKLGRLLAPANPRIDSLQSSFPIGPMSIFYATAKELKLTDKIRDVLEVTDKTSSLLLCLVLNQLVSKRAISKLAPWVLRSPLITWEHLDENIDAKEFEQALGNLCVVYPDGMVEDNGLVLQYELTKDWRGDTGEPAQFFYDVTKQKYYGTSCFYGEPGYIPGGTNKSVVGFGLVTSKTHHHPVMCRAIRGSKNDTITVQDTVNTLKAWGFERLTLILDRGMISKENVEFVVNSGFDLVGIVPETNKKVWSYVTRWLPEDLARPQFLVRRPSGGAVYVRAWTAPLFGMKKVRVVVVEDPERKMEERIARDQALRELSGTPPPARLRELRRELGDLVVPARGRRGFVVDKAKVEANREGDGRFLLFSTDLSMSAEDIFSVYFQKDIVEKSFRTLKGEIRLGPIRYRRRDRIDAYATIVYLAYLLWTMAERRLRKKFPDMTLEQALDIVEDVCFVRFRHGEFIRGWVTKLTEEQRRVLKLLGATRFLPVS